MLKNIRRILLEENRKLELFHFRTKKNKMY